MYVWVMEAPNIIIHFWLAVLFGRKDTQTLQPPLPLLTKRGELFKIFSFFFHYWPFIYARMT